jgi:arsenate reductase (thioredoxin)
MNQNPIVVFVCEHGAAKSILAASYFNKLANEMGLDLRAIARGTSPDQELSPQTVAGLSKDGLQPTESTPQKLEDADLQNAQRVITFCELPVKYEQQSTVEHWDGIPPVSENYEQARDVIIERIRQLLD